MPDATEGGPEVRASAPDQWLLVFEAKPGAPVPMAVMMRQFVKHTERYTHLRVVRVCNNVPHPDFEPVEFSEE